MRFISQELGRLEASFTHLFPGDRNSWFPPAAACCAAPEEKLELWLNTSLDGPSCSGLDGQCDGCEDSNRNQYLLQLLLLLQSEHLGVVTDLASVALTGADSRLAHLDGTFQVGPPHTIHVPEENGCSLQIQGTFMIEDIIKYLGSSSSSV